MKKSVITYASSLWSHLREKYYAKAYRRIARHYGLSLIPQRAPVPEPSVAGTEDKAVAGVKQMAVQLKEFMERNYVLRRNLIKGVVECKKKGETAFHSLTKEVLNGMTLSAHEEGIPLWDRDIKRYVYSDRVPLHNPARAYLESLPVWDGQDRIRELAARVPTEDVHWQDYFYRWFLSLVQQWRSSEAQEQGAEVLPVLIGKQGIGKSVWCRKLLPPELAEYYADGLDLTIRKEAERSLGRYMLVNLDEFDNISSSRQAYLKQLLQKPQVQVRQSYTDFVEPQARHAAFIACCNQPDLLSDTSGNRRFIGIEVNSRIKRGKIAYNQLYAQALAALDAGERYWFDEAEEQRFTPGNAAFELRPVEEQLLLCHFRPAEEGEEGGRWMMAIEVVQQLQKLGGTRIPQGSARSFGRLLRKHGYICKHTHRGTEFFVAAA